MNESTYYFGQWDTDTSLPEGRGIAVYKDCSVYEGFWKDGKRHGYGRMIFGPSGDIYQGEWINDTTDGCYGYFVKKSGLGIKCDWNHSKPHGEGFESDGKGNWYRGGFSNGMKEGKGKCHFYDGSTYEGDFKESKMDGNGVYTYKDGRKYTGSFMNNQMHGKGVFESKKGQRYEGEYLNGVKEGYGTFDYGDGRVYRGNWKNGKQHGEGVFAEKNGTEKKGTWKDGEFDRLEKHCVR